MALGILPPVATAAGAWPHRPVLPTVGGSPNVIAHGGRNSKCHGPRRQIYICRKFWFDHLFFENHDKLNIKKKSKQEFLGRVQLAGPCGARRTIAHVSPPWAINGVEPQITDFLFYIILFLIFTQIYNRFQLLQNYTTSVILYIFVNSSTTWRYCALPTAVPHGGRIQSIFKKS
jgi:hypothetical protein